MIKNVGGCKMNLEGIIVDGKVYVPKKDVDGYTCSRCALYGMVSSCWRVCRLNCMCPLHGNGHFEEKEEEL